MSDGDREQRRELLRELGEAIWGEEWIAPAAREVKVNIRTMQRWAAGERDDAPPEDVLGTLQVRAGLASVRLKQRIDKIRTLVALRFDAARLSFNENRPPNGYPFEWTQGRDFSHEQRKEIGSRIRQARIAVEPRALLFLDRLEARSLKLKPQVLHSYEAGRLIPGDDFIIPFCAETGVSSQWILDGTIPDGWRKLDCDEASRLISMVDRSPEEQEEFRDRLRSGEMVAVQRKPHGEIFMGSPSQAIARANAKTGGENQTTETSETIPAGTTFVIEAGGFQPFVHSVMRALRDIGTGEFGGVIGRQDDAEAADNLVAALTESGAAENVPHKVWTL